MSSTNSLKGSHCSTNDEGLGQSSTSVENDQPMLEKKEFIKNESIKEAIGALEGDKNVESSYDDSDRDDEGENFDEFSLSDIPEIPSALEKHTERSITPYPR